MAASVHPNEPDRHGASVAGERFVPGCRRRVDLASRPRITVSIPAVAGNFKRVRQAGGWRRATDA